MSTRKLPVAINVFPTLDYVELVQYDDKTGEIEKASSLPCQFDLNSRQVANWEQMGQAIRDLCSMNRIPPGSPAVLVLPSFFTREIELLADFSRDELRFALVSEAERFFVFKKTEPQIDWVTLSSGRLMYSAYPKEEIEKYVELFREARIPLMGIELGYFSAVRGLMATGAVREELEAEANWCLLSINDSSFFASIQNGPKILKTVEAPLSSAVENEGSAIQEIQQDFESFVAGEDYSKLIVVNNAERIRTEDLINHLGLQGNVIIIEQNGQTLHSRGAEAAQFPCSLEGLGGVFYAAFPEMVHLNFLPETSEDVAGIMHYRQAALKWLGIANGAVFILCLGLWGIMNLLVWQKNEEIKNLSLKAAELTQLANSGQFNELNRKRFVKKVVDHNAQVNNVLVRLGRLIPTDTWIEKIQIDATETLKPILITAEGKTLNLDDVNKFRTQLSEGLSGNELEVTNAAPLTSQDGQSYFTWSIQNKAAADPATQQGPTPPPGSRIPGGIRGMH